MEKRKVYLSLISMLGIFSMILSGCVDDELLKPILEQSPPIQSGTPQNNNLAIPFDDKTSPVPLPTSTSSVTPVQVLNSTPVPDLRLNPDNWQEWPVIPKVSQRAIEIYKRGIASGNDPHSFSVVGDCQAIKDVFLGPFGDRRLYLLENQNKYLQETIDYFSGSFNRDGMAVRGGFTAASILSPMYADPILCQPGETPLSCEFRVHKPSILIVSLETWRDANTIDRYQLYLNKIIEFSIENGVLPILGTKADVAEVGDGKHYINPAIAQIAYNYDLPLWNFYKAVEYVENRGIDADRDAFHLNQQGLWIKRLTALQALDAVWRAANGLSDQPTDLTSTPMPSPTVSSYEMLKINPETTTDMMDCIPGEGISNNCILFELSTNLEGNILTKGIFLYLISKNELTQLAPDGAHLLGISPNGLSLVENFGKDLYIVPLSGDDPILVTAQYYDSSMNGAYWMADNKNIVYLCLNEGQPGICRYSTDNRSQTLLSRLEDTPINLLHSSDLEYIYWENGQCTEDQNCTSSGYRVSDLSGKSKILMDMINPAISPDLEHFAYMHPRYRDSKGFNNMVLVASLSNPTTSIHYIYFPFPTGFKVQNRIQSFNWSPDGSQLLIFLDEFSNYYGKTAGYHVYTWSKSNGRLIEYTRITGAFPQSAWSSDQKYILLTDTQHLETGNYKINLQLLDINNKILSQLDINTLNNLTEFTYISNMLYR